MKNYRHQKIMDIIRENEVETQEELASLLAEAGFSVTQATVSRDIKQLNLKKSSSINGKQCYCVNSGKEPVQGDRLVQILKAGFVSMEQAQNLIVIKTVSGMAMAVAAAIDAISLPKMAGSIAGDDTIMCAIKTTEDVPEVMEELNRLIEG